LAIDVFCGCGHHFKMPEGNAGLYASCPICMRILIVPGAAISRPTDPADLIYIADEPPRVSRTAVGSLVLGLLVFAWCFSGVPAIFLGIGALGEIRRSGGRLRGRGLAIAGIILGSITCLATVALPYMNGGPRGAARRAWCVNNLKQIGLALHNYHETYDSLPPAAIADKNGRPLLSWRVAILPFIEANDLYEKFHLDEPWDSPHNLSLLDQMPSVYKCPSDSTLKSGMTGYQAIIDPAAVFTPDFQSRKFDEITDGTDKTILVGESRRGVPWTKPEDLPVDPNVPLTGLGSHHNGGFNVLFADGSVRFLKSTISPQTLRMLITRDGQEVCADDSY